MKHDVFFKKIALYTCHYLLRLRLKVKTTSRTGQRTNSLWLHFYSNSEWYRYHQLLYLEHNPSDLVSFLELLFLIFRTHLLTSPMPISYM